MDTPVLGLPLWQVVLAAVALFFAYKYFRGSTPSPVSEEKKVAGFQNVQMAPSAAPSAQPRPTAPANLPKAIIYNFNTSWCGYSVDFQPTWDAFSSELSKSRPSSEVVALDMKCDNNANRDLCMKWEIRGFPTVIKVVTDGTVDNNGHPNGKMVELDGPRNMDSLKALAQ